MQKVIIKKPGSYDQLCLEEHPSPTPTGNEIQIAVAAIGVNYADCVIRMGLYKSAKEFVGWPITPGFEVAGTIKTVGPEVTTDWQIGDEVIAVTLFGGYASEVCIAQPQVFRKPANMSMSQAAGFSAVYLTAWYGLCEQAHPRPGQRMLVHSAAGGVGSALLQLGKLQGCHVTAVVGGSHKVETAQKLGADAVIDKSQTPLWQQAKALQPEGYHLIFDANGVSTLGDSYQHLAPTGKLVIYGFHSMLPKQGGKPNWLKLARDWLRTPRFNPLNMTSDNKSVLALNLSYLTSQHDLLAEAMEYLLSAYEQGRLTLPPNQAFDLSQVAEAQQALESGTTVGKLLLLP